MRRGLVSIVIPCRNAAPWLADAIRSCLDQSWRAVEILVVDNGSTDDSVAIAGSFTDRGVTVARCEKPGASSARNVGLALAQGEYVQFLDADDLLHRDKIRLQMERLEHLPEGRIASGEWATFQEDPGTAVFVPESIWRDLAPGEFMIGSWQGGGMMPVFAWLAPREVIDRAGPWNEELSLDDDGEFFTRVNLTCTGVTFCAGARGYYRKSQRVSLSSRSDSAALESGFRAALLSTEAVLSASDPSHASVACADKLQRFVHAAYPAVPHLVGRAERRIRELGGSRVQPLGGRAFRILSKCFGWKFASGLRRFSGRISCR